MKLRRLLPLGLLIISEGAIATEPPRASATCVACHGEAGVSANDLWPNLAGQKRGYLKAQLHLFQSGARVNPLMSPIAQTLSPFDIEELAAYFSALPLRTDASTK